MAKLTPAAKISANLDALKKVSAVRAQIETLASLTENAEVKEFILAQNDRYSVDIDYLRKNIAYQAMKFAETQNVEGFEKFAIGLAKLVS